MSTVLFFAAIAVAISAAVAAVAVHERQADGLQLGTLLALLASRLG